MPLEFLTYFLAFVILLIAASVHASMGFGFGIIAAPMLVFIAPFLVPGPLIFVALVLTILMALRERTHIDFGGLKWTIAGRIPGSAIGALMLMILSQSAILLMVGILVLVAVTLSVVTPRFRPTRAALVCAGLMSGFMGTTASIGGPPIALIYQHVAGSVFRSTLSLYFVIGSVISLSALRYVGLFGYREVVASAALIPAVLIGFFASNWILPKLNEIWMKRAILAIAAIAGVAIVAKHISAV